MKPRDAVAIFAASMLVVGEVVPDKHKPHWLDSHHSHVEVPEGTTGTFGSRIVDSGAMTNIANTL